MYKLHNNDNIFNSIVYQEFVDDVLVTNSRKPVIVVNGISH